MVVVSCIGCLQAMASRPKLVMGGLGAASTGLIYLALWYGRPRGVPGPRIHTQGHAR
jgi:hypothetical protein